MDENTKTCCRGFILALFQGTTASKLDSDYKKLFPVCGVEKLQVTVNKVKFYHLFGLVSGVFH